MTRRSLFTRIAEMALGLPLVSRLRAKPAGGVKIGGRMLPFNPIEKWEPPIIFPNSKAFTLTDYYGIKWPITEKSQSVPLIFDNPYSDIRASKLYFRNESGKCA